MQQNFYSGQAIWLFYRVSDRSCPSRDRPCYDCPRHIVEVITVMMGVDMTGAGAVSHNGEAAISGANQAIIKGAVMTMTDMTGSVMAGTATVCNRFTVPTNVQQVNVGAL